jgi:hypothetical protein
MEAMESSLGTAGVETWFKEPMDASEQTHLNFAKTGTEMVIPCAFGTLRLGVRKVTLWDEQK